MIAERIPQIESLSPREKLILANELYDDFDQSPSESRVDEKIEELLTLRMAEYERDASLASTWEDFRKKWGRE